jgi:Proteins containing SET domain
MSALKICVDRNGQQKWMTPSELEQLTGVKFISALKMESEEIHQRVCRIGEKKGVSKNFLVKLWKGFRRLFDPPEREMGVEQIWRGQYYKKEIESGYIPDVILRWIDASLGWGVFAARSFKPREYIAEYTGVLRKWKKSDRKNGYCFEYVYESGKSTPFLIDASEEAGIARYINHSEKGNLELKLATIGSITHVILLTKRPIEKGEQLSYHYGPAYWAKRPPPILL